MECFWRFFHHNSTCRIFFGLKLHSNQLKTISDLLWKYQSQGSSIHSKKKKKQFKNHQKSAFFRLWKSLIFEIFSIFFEYLQEKKSFRAETFQITTLDILSCSWKISATALQYFWSYDFLKVEISWKIHWKSFFQDMKNQRIFHIFYTSKTHHII